MENEEFLMDEELIDSISYYLSHPEELPVSESVK